ncbi:MAG: ABC transporter ATP-binding protein [Desulfovibrionaceae bacterium]
MPAIEINGLSKAYSLNGHAFQALHGVSARVEHGGLVTVVGRSGCGKTTLLRLLCGLEQPSGGTVRFLDESGAPTGARIGVVFQEARLMPWLTVEKNMAFGLEGRLGRDQARRAVSRGLEMLHLTAFRHAYPSQISGGMAQRVALGRTLCADPDIILMDEPFGALDAFTRRNLQLELTRIFLHQSKTIVFVTHDVDEAAFLGQRVLVMDAGTIVADLPVPLPYPRSTLSGRFFNVREGILSAVMGDTARTTPNQEEV